MEKGHGPAALEAIVSEEAVALPLQKSVQDHRREQLPYISDLKAISLVENNNQEIIDIIAIMDIIHFN